MLLICTYCIKAAITQNEIIIPSLHCPCKMRKIVAKLLRGLFAVTGMYNDF